MHWHYLMNALFKNLTKYIGLSIILVGCATIAQHKLDQRWGEAQVRERSVASTEHSIPEYHRDIQPIFDKRCVTCHACYDGPCQLKLDTYDGLDRGASKELVYDGTRLLASAPSRLGVDEKNTQAWRERDYYPVLNERVQTQEANLYGSLLYRMLLQKKQNPLPDTKQLDDEVFDFSTSRAQECPTIEEYEDFAKSHPQLGMPFGMPAISDEDFSTVEQWIEAGSPVKALAPLGKHYLDKVKLWEEFFNGGSNKERLFARYAYEHLYLGNLWFEELGHTQYFKLVRSRTPSGSLIDEIASRRPFDDPNVDRVYYRLKPVRGTIVDKTHMPYALNAKRMEKWKAWFITPEYEVPSLPSYVPEEASNPFLSFKYLPVSARYKFMLEEAEYTIMGYIKGPVCRGQVALNVIEDHFWVFFVDPDIPTMLFDHSIAQNDVDARIEHLRLPAAEQSNASPFDIWTRYSELQERHLNDKLAYMNSKAQEGAEIGLGLIWNGRPLLAQDAHGEAFNQNAALSIFRHFDNATVVKGLHGRQPKTAWVINYSLLERIHYLLVAGFDVYGNVGHQLNTRLYMDFLRMEGESNFLMLLPEHIAASEFLSWYKGAESEVSSYLGLLQKTNLRRSNLSYQTDDPKSELFAKLSEYLGDKVLPEPSVLNGRILDKKPKVDKQLARLSTLRGKGLALLPELSMVRLTLDDGQQTVFTIALNRYHQNVSSLFMEEKRLKLDGFNLTLYPGVLGSYPNTFYDVHEHQLERFVDRLSNLTTEEDYRSVLDTFAVRRSDENFWSYVDWLHAWYRTHQAMKAGVIDLNRFENR